MSTRWRPESPRVHVLWMLCYRHELSIVQEPWGLALPRHRYHECCITSMNLPQDMHHECWFIGMSCTISMSFLMSLTHLQAYGVLYHSTINPIVCVLWMSCYRHELSRVHRSWFLDYRINLLQYMHNNDCWNTFISLTVNVPWGPWFHQKICTINVEFYTWASTIYILWVLGYRLETPKLCAPWILGYRHDHFTVYAS